MAQKAEDHIIAAYQNIIIWKDRREAVFLFCADHVAARESVVWPLTDIRLRCGERPLSEVKLTSCGHAADVGLRPEADMPFDLLFRKLNCGIQG